MDLMPRLARWALGRPHVLLVDAGDSRGLRWRVEAELDRRRWPAALSPADADLLLILGDPGPRVAAAVDLLWSQVPMPRHRRQLLNGVDLEQELGAALSSLRQPDPTTKSTDPGGHAGHTGHVDHGEPAVPAKLTDADGHDDHGPSTGIDVNEEPGASGDDHHEAHPEQGVHPSLGADGDHSYDVGVGDHDEHAGHGDRDEHEGYGEPSGHDGHVDHGADEGHHMHHGGEVAGLSMASTAPDRDGLELDALRVSLGPVLPGWPTGLVLSGMLQGDVLTDAEVSWLDDPPVVEQGDVSGAAALDLLARFLLVAGWPVAARRAREARHDLLSIDETAVRRGCGRAVRLAGPVRRSRTLAWSVRGIGTTSDGGDALDRVYRWCDAAAGRSDADANRNVTGLDELSNLVEGRELASARLLVASFDLEAAAAGAGTGIHGA